MVNVGNTPHDQERHWEALSDMVTRQSQTRRTIVEEPAKERDFADIQEVLPFAYTCTVSNPVVE